MVILKNKSVEDSFSRNDMALSPRDDHLKSKKEYYKSCWGMPAGDSSFCSDAQVN
jgi:hypothetical protein